MGSFIETQIWNRLKAAILHLLDPKQSTLMPSVIMALIGFAHSFGELPPFIENNLVAWITAGVTYVFARLWKAAATANDSKPAPTA